MSHEKPAKGTPIMSILLACEECGCGYWADRGCVTCRNSKAEQMKARTLSPKLIDTYRCPKNDNTISVRFDRNLTDTELKFFTDCLSRWQSLT